MRAGGSARTFMYVVGARPNFMKTAPVVRAMRARAPGLRHLLVHTGQHYDIEMSRVFFEQLDLPVPDHNLGVGSATAGAQMGAIMVALEDLIVREAPDIVVVPGDVNSTLAAALTAAAQQVPVAHIEAGLRSFDRTMPEELNRILTDQIAELLFIHSPEARENLVREGIDARRIHFSGNTMIDTLVRLSRRAEEEDGLLDRLGVRSPFLLVTLHRPALVDGDGIVEALAALQAVTRDLDVVFPVHPRTSRALERHAVGAPDVRLLPPLGYLEFLSLQRNAAAVLTDSGGIQEETTFLGVPCFTLRDNTDRPVTITQGTNVVLGLKPDRITEIPALLNGRPPPRAVPEGWDGHAGERIADVLLRDHAG